MIHTRARSVKVFAVVATGFLMASITATAASAVPDSATPTVDVVCGPDNDTVTFPTLEGVTYSDTGWVEGERTITAIVAEGLVLDGESSWTLVDKATLCPFEYIEKDATPATPTVVPLCGPNNDSVTIHQVNGVIYAAGAWVGGERTVTATAGYGYELLGTAAWTLTDVPVAGCADEGPVFSSTPTGDLAYTGATPVTGPLAALAILLVGAGAGLVARKARA